MVADSGNAHTALVFPGMGPSRFEDIAKFMLINPFARKLVAEADKVLGYSLFDAYRDAKGEYNRHAQVAFVVNCLAFAQWAEDTIGVEPDLITGPSFGGRAAAAHSGAVSFAEVVWLTSQLATVMDEYFTAEHPDIVTHSFVRTPLPELTKILGELTEAGHWHEISCRLDHDFHMLSLGIGQVDWVKRRLSSIGGLSLYTMQPPMHASIFAGLRERVDAEIFSQVTWADPVVPVIADQDGSVRHTGAGVRTMLLDGFVRAVQWPDVVATLQSSRVTKLYVAGQDSMFGRVPCTTRNFEVVGINPRFVMQPRARVVAVR
ncbi:[acyl-carrier-protein] S-malonyltransferase [Kibdelosporangium banguiense]|uniref:[acyl-carrier-protein] S-malonyltransferase n=1 Tax=Kibdelosporangium banguiense TaxID=1365924 RepID=A0ABS4TN29_9PSEU|nr:ACP S-malonyltransferase [Kibdelosporangium banguiense]MBP2325815.1 [acyl-carrier-protein] S-malonyltransferase [Kibdelosporangium banguiense]